MASASLILAEIDRIKYQYRNTYQSATFALGFNHTIAKIRDGLKANRKLDILITEIKHKDYKDNEDYIRGVIQAVTFISQI